MRSERDGARRRAERLAIPGESRLSEQSSTFDFKTGSLAVSVFLAAGLIACGGPTDEDWDENTVASTGGEAETPPEEEPTGEIPRCRAPNAPAEEVFERGQALEQQHDSTGAVAAYREACEAGNPCACSELGWATVAGHGGIDADVTDGIALLRRGCDNGDGPGCRLLGAAYFRAAHDPTSARSAFSAACEGDEPSACFELGRLLISGVGGEANVAEAAALYTRACEGGTVSACVTLASCNFYGLGVDANPERARELLDWSCDAAHNPMACRSRALFWPGDESAAALAQACDAGDVAACDAAAADGASRAGTTSEALDLESTEGAVDVAADSTQPLEASLGGDVHLEELGLRPACVGSVSRAPSAIFNLAEGAASLSLRGVAQADTTLALRTPAGEWLCVDDPPGGNYIAAIDVPTPAAGTYRVWIGAFDRAAVGTEASITVAAAP